MLCGSLQLISSANDVELRHEILGDKLEVTSSQNRVKFGNFIGLYLLEAGIGLQLTAKFCTKGNSALENFQSTTLDFR